MDESHKLELKARKIVTALRLNPNLKAVLLTGSVAKGLADKYSDVELKFVWYKKPTLKQRLSVFQDLKFEVLVPEYFEDFEYYSAILVDNVKFDISQCTQEDISKAITELTFKYSPNVDF